MTTENVNSNESILLNLLRTRSNKKDTLVYAHAAAETQNTINESYHPTSNKGGQTEAGYLEVFPRTASRPPRLLADLEALLIDR